MSALDWVVLGATLAAIVAYGVWRSRGVQSAEAFLRPGSDLKWWTIGLSVIATQASAITFLSVPGQGYQDGLRFVQFYFGLPIAMVILSAVIVPVYHRLKVYTAYEYLERRFDRRTRLLVAALFLVSRGLASGLAIYAPALVLSAVLGWPVVYTNAILGFFTVVYTVMGGSRAVARTQSAQMAVILVGMVVAFVVAVSLLPRGVSVGQALSLAGELGRLEAVDTSVRMDTRYTLWSGLLGGLFVQLAYFGTDQSQVQRYLSGGPLAQSRLGLLMNGLIKVPMQLYILLVGVLVFAVYQFTPPPLSFNRVQMERAYQADAPAITRLDEQHTRAFQDKRAALDRYLASSGAEKERALAEVREQQKNIQALRLEAREVFRRTAPASDPKDDDHIFLRFVLDNFPAGLVGLLVAVILSAAMSANSGALAALGSSTVVDFFVPFVPGASDRRRLGVARLATAGWGVIAVLFAYSAAYLDNLIQAVNILGSLFYGPMLGVFLLGMFVPRAGPSGAFWGVVLGELAVFAAAGFSTLGFLWFNVIGCAVVLVVGALAGPGRGAPPGGAMDAKPPAAG